MIEKGIQELIKYLNEQVEKSTAIRREKKIVVTNSEKEKNFVIDMLKNIEGENYAERYEVVLLKPLKHYDFKKAEQVKKAMEGK